MEKPTFIIIPKLRNKNLNLLNIPSSQWTVYMVFAGILSVLFFLISLANGWLQAFFIVIFLLAFFIFYKFFRKEEVVERTKLVYNFLFRKFSGENEFAKYREKDFRKIKDSLSIVEIHDKGLIQFDLSHYSALIRYVPPTVNGDNLWPYVLQTKAIVDSLLPNMLLKIFVVSVGNDPVKFKREVLEASNSVRSKQKKEHLLSIYKMMEAKKDRAPEWNFYMLLDFGKYDSHEEAVIASENYYPGFKDRLEQVGIKSRRITQEAEILLALRNAINPIHPILEDLK
jgi:Ca2+/Na+ antiporter